MTGPVTYKPSSRESGQRGKPEPAVNEPAGNESADEPSLIGRVLVVCLQRTLKRRLARMTHFGDAELHASRRRVERGAQLFPPLPRGSTYESVSAGGIRGVWLRAPGVPPLGQDAGALLYLHGGGYAVGSPRVYRDICVRLSAALELPILIVDYRRSPEHPFPAAVEDALTAWRWLVTGGARPSRSIVAGDSAGGGLSLALTLALKADDAPLPACALLMSPWTDLSVSGDCIKANEQSDAYLSPRQLQTAARAYLAGADPHEPLASPLFGDLGGLPPLCIHYSQSELLADDSRRLAERARAAGVEVSLSGWPGLPHAFQIFAPILPEARASLKALAAFAQARVDSGV